MIIKKGEFISFTPAELHGRATVPAPPRPRKVVKRAQAAKAKHSVPSARNDLLEEIERLIRANERLTLERDQLREEFSRQSLEARRSKIARKKPAPVSAPVNENLRRQELEPAPIAREQESAESTPNDTVDAPGLELARVVVNWFWEDADEASVRLVHDALTGQGVRTLVRDADTEAE